MVKKKNESETYNWACEYRWFCFSHKLISLLKPFIIYPKHQMLWKKISFYLFLWLKAYLDNKAWNILDHTKQKEMKSQKIKSSVFIFYRKHMWSQNYLMFFLLIFASYFFNFSTFFLLIWPEWLRPWNLWELITQLKGPCWELGRPNKKNLLVVCGYSLVGWGDMIIFMLVNQTHGCHHVFGLGFVF